MENKEVVTHYDFEWSFYKARMQLNDNRKPLFYSFIVITSVLFVFYGQQETTHKLIQYGNLLAMFLLGYSSNYIFSIRKKLDRTLIREESEFKREYRMIYETLKNKDEYCKSVRMKHLTKDHGYKEFATLHKVESTKYILIKDNDDPRPEDRKTYNGLFEVISDNWIID